MGASGVTGGSEARHAAAEGAGLGHRRERQGVHQGRDQSRRAAPAL